MLYLQANFIYKQGKTYSNFVADILIMDHVSTHFKRKHELTRDPDEARDEQKTPGQTDSAAGHEDNRRL